MTKIIHKVVEYCNRDCIFYEMTYSDCHGDIAKCCHDDGKVIYGHKDLYKNIEVPFGPKSLNLTHQKTVWNDDLFPITPPEWCPLDDIKDKGVLCASASIFLKEEKVLMGKRKGDVVMSNMWAFPGGKRLKKRSERRNKYRINKCQFCMCSK